MKVYLYSEWQKQIEKSGVGRAIYHQTLAAARNGISCDTRLQDADVVHINTVFLRSFLLALRAKRKGIPVVYHAHSTREDFRNSYLGSNLVSGLFQAWLKLCYSCGDMIITPTPYSKRLLQSYGIQKEIQVISNGIDLTEYRRDPVAGAAFRKKYGYKADDKIILSAGLLIRRKGILDFVALAKRMPEYQFIWFGWNNLYTVGKDIRHAVREKLPNLRFAGYVPKKELQAAYSGCDLFWFPSYEETEGIVVLEALAMQIPVLLRDIPVYEDWLADRKEVYKGKTLEGFENRIRRIFSGELPNLTDAGYQCAKDRSLERIGTQLKQVYQSCIVQCRSK